MKQRGLPFLAREVIFDEGLEESQKARTKKCAKGGVVQRQDVVHRF